MSVLIGQLGKNSKVKDNTLTDDELITLALDIIEKVTNLIGGRTILVKCKDNEKLMEFYGKHDFKRFNGITHQENNLIKLLKFL